MGKKRSKYNSFFGYVDKSLIALSVGYVDKSLIALSVASGIISIASFIGIPVKITSASLDLAFSLCAGTKNKEQVTRTKIVILARSN